MENKVVTTATSTQQVQPDPIKTQQNPTNVSLLDILGFVGVTSVIIALIYIGKKLQILDDLKITTDKIKVNINVVSNFLTRNNKNFNPKELQLYSPLQLTEEGDKLIGELDFEDVFTKNKPDFFQYIDEENPKLKYDVEVAAIKSIYVLYEKPYMSFLKVYFYNHPNRNLENTAPTLGIYIREKYLSEHIEIIQ